MFSPIMGFAVGASFKTREVREGYAVSILRFSSQGEEVKERPSTSARRLGGANVSAARQQRVPGYR
jgi:hypothetical protein